MVAQNEWSRNPIAALWRNISMSDKRGNLLGAVGMASTIAEEMVGREREEVAHVNQWPSHGLTVDRGPPARGQRSSHIFY